MILVFRLGHRLPRDERITTHVALVARAFGASGMYYSGMRDLGMEAAVKDVVKRWGGSFFIEFVENPKQKLKELKDKGFKIVHLTMYGLSLDKITLPKSSLVIVVGSEKVPSWVYELAHINVSVTNQPHSEVAALAICLDRIWKGKELSLDFQSTYFGGGELQIIPSPKGKRIIHRKR